MFYQGEVLPCNFTLDWRPSPVGKSGAFVGKYLWAEDGGALLFWPFKKGCPAQNLWSAEELQEMGIAQVTGFHTRNALLLSGKHLYVWDLDERILRPLTWVHGWCKGQTNFNDQLLVCLQHTKEKGILIQVWRVTDHSLWREHIIPASLVPNYFYPTDIDWSPTADMLVYYRCVEPNLKNPSVCEEKGRDNLGIYIWDLETNEERLVTTGGVFPYWADWGKTP